MDLNQYSFLISIAIIALFAGVLLSAILFLLSKWFREKILSLTYFHYIWGILGLSLISTVGAMIYQLVYLTPVCILCWWQRVFMFPIIIVTAVSLYYKSKISHVMTLIMSAIGTFYAGYHYYYHFQALVLGNNLTLPCSSFGLLPSCTESPILVFGFITIPLMGLVSFLSIFWLSFLASRKKDF